MTSELKVFSFLHVLKQRKVNSIIECFHCRAVFVSRKRETQLIVNDLESQKDAREIKSEVSLFLTSLFKYEKTTIVAQETQQPVTS